jgi:hypothetical protein
MALWLTMAVLPNVQVQEPIEAGIAAFVPLSDPRIGEINNSHPRHRSFLNRFTDAFGVKRDPTILLARPNAPRWFMRADTVASFRDVLSMSVVPRSRALSIQYDRALGVQFARAFDIFPWIIDKHYEHLIAITPAMMALHDVSKFKGQTSPEMSPVSLSKSDIDEPLFDELVVRWRRRYRATKADWGDIALMRSLNMAHHASQLPAPSLDATMLDVGRLVALWVSAFEILIHPGGTGKANQWGVYDQLEQVKWLVRRNRARNIKCVAKKPKTFERRQLPSWLYQQLYGARNDFLHGNPIHKRRLRLKHTNRGLLDFAAPLYRLALTAFLDLRFKDPSPPMTDAKALAQHWSQQWDFNHYQRDVEVAVAMARGHKPDGRRRSRKAPGHLTGGE